MLIFDSRLVDLDALYSLDPLLYREEVGCGRRVGEEEPVQTGY
jgi:hypothetical protein